MREIPPALASHFAEDATTLCHAWRVSRRDGQVLGFTDHDRDLAIGSTLYRAASGFLASDWEAESGLAAPSGDIAGAFSSEAITEADVAAGRYDGALVDLFLVNWTATDQHMRLKRFEIGDITRSDGHFRAELRSLAHRLAAVRGRIYASRCDATLGDNRCGVDTDNPALKAEGSVLDVVGQDRITVAGLDAFSSGFFRYGLLTFTGGANAGASVDIGSHRRQNGMVTLVFWLPLAVPAAAGDAFSILAGCDKSFATCRHKFSNPANFRGFPHLPGADFAYSYADGETEHDGRPLYD